MEESIGLKRLIPSIKILTHCSPNIMELIHKVEMHLSALRNFYLLFVVQRDFLLISGSRKFSNNLPRSRLTGMFTKFYNITFRNVLQSSTNTPLENSSTFEKVPNNSFSF